MSQGFAKSKLTAVTVIEKPTLGTEQLTTSGTFKDFTEIPAWVTKIEINCVGVSTNGSSFISIRIGDSGGIETTGYLGAWDITSNPNVVTASTYTSGWGLGSGGAANVWHGTISITLEDPAAFTWVCAGRVGFSNVSAMGSTAGSKSLTGALDRVRITTVNGTDTFDAGAINIRYS